MLRLIMGIVWEAVKVAVGWGHPLGHPCGIDVHLTRADVHWWPNKEPRGDTDQTWTVLFADGSFAVYDAEGFVCGSAEPIWA